MLFHQNGLGTNLPKYSTAEVVLYSIANISPEADAFLFSWTHSSYMLNKLFINNSLSKFRYQFNRSIQVFQIHSQGKLYYWTKLGFGF